MAKSKAASATDGRVHLHIENAGALGPVFEATPERVEAALAAHPGLGQRVRVTIGYDGDIYDEVLADTDVLFGWSFDRERLAERAPRLRWVHAHGAGINHLMPLDWLPKGAVLTNSRGVHGAKADEYTLMAILALNNRLPEMVTNQRRGTWEQPFSTSVAGKTLLIVGVGHVGGGAARLAKLVGLRVVGVRRSGKPHRHVEEMHRPEALRRLMAEADFVLVTAPHTPESEGMIGRAEIEAMKTGAGLVNYSRAQLVDYEALRERLEKGELSAVLDVFDPEPLPADSPLWQTPNLIITPHCSSDDAEYYTPRTLDLVMRNMERFLAGKPLLNRVDPKRLY